MKNIFTALMLLLSLIFTSCEDDKNKQAVPQPTISPKKCWLIESQTGSNNVKYFYDSNKRIERAIGTHGTQTNVQTYEFDLKNQMIKYSTLDTLGNIRSYTTFEYNNLGKISKQISYRKENNIFVPSSTIVYQYNSNNVLVRSDRSNNNSTPSYYDTYTYGNQTLKIQSFDPTGNLQSTTVYEFDTKKAPNSEGGGSGTNSIFPPNNILKLTTTYTQANISPFSSTYSYQYNEQDYPVQATITYSNKPTEIITYTYDCH